MRPTAGRFGLSIAMTSPLAFLPDTSCIVAAVTRRHPQHPPARTELETRLERDEQMVVAAHTLAEAYRVLTGWAPPHRLSPPAAWQVLKTSFVETATVVALTPDELVAALADASGNGVAGATIHDSLIAATARRAG